MEPPAVVSGGAFTVQHGLPLLAAAPSEKSAAPTANIVAKLATPWPRRVQGATAVLLFLAALLLLLHTVIVQPGGSRPTELQRGNGLKYRLDLNKARRADLVQLPNIGPALAERIEAYRSDNGGFASVEELTKVKGIGPAILQRLRPFVYVKADDEAESTDTDTGKPEMRVSAYPPAAGDASKTPGKNKVANLKGPINLNRASQAELRQLPGIGPTLSLRIIETRDQRPFAAVEELRRVKGIGVKTLEKLRPLVTVGD